MAKSTKTVKTAHTFETIKVWFVWSAALYYISQFVLTVSMYIRIPEPQRDPETWSTWFAMHAVVALVWVLVWLSKRKRDLTNEAMFDVTLVTVTLLFFLWTLATVSTEALIPGLYRYNNSPDFVNTLLFALPVLLTVPVSLGLILHLRRDKKW